MSINQLKSVAIKLKKRVAELTVQLNAAEEARTKVVAERQEKDSMKAASKTIQVRLMTHKGSSTVLFTIIAVILSLIGSLHFLQCQ